MLCSVYHAKKQAGGGGGGSSSSSSSSSSERVQLQRWASPLHDDGDGP